jgi:hypothetical protein
MEYYQELDKLRNKTLSQLKDAQEEILEQFISELNDLIPNGTKCKYLGKHTHIMECGAYFSLGNKNEIRIYFLVDEDGQGNLADEHRIEFLR